MRSMFYFKPLQLEGEEGLDNRVHICIDENNYSLRNE